MYITFEGPEATGKSTQVELLGSFLREQGKKVLVTKEPGTPHNDVCQQIRKLLLHPGNEIVERASLFLFLADRAQHMEKVVIPFLQDGGWVVSDRSSLSTLVYHLAAKEAGCEYDFSTIDGSETFFSMLNFAQQVRPDLGFISSSSLKWSDRRMDERTRDRIEARDNEFHKKIHTLFETSVKIKAIREANFVPRKLVGLPSVPEYSIEQIAEYVIEEVR